MDELHLPRSKTRILLSISLIVASFVFVAWFFLYVPFSPSNKLMMWAVLLISGFLFFSGYCVGSNINFKKMLSWFLVVIVWSMGFVVLPVPEGYAETVYGSWAILLMAIVALYYRREKSRRNQARKRSSNCNTL